MKTLLLGDLSPTVNSNPLFKEKTQKSFFMTQSSFSVAMMLIL